MSDLDDESTVFGNESDNEFGNEYDNTGNGGRSPLNRFTPDVSNNCLNKISMIVLFFPKII